MAPYSFHYDLSKTLNNKFLLLYYLIAFNDLHNFYMSAENYRKIFREEYLSVKIPLKIFNVDDPFSARNANFITRQSRLDARDGIDAWDKKLYPETRDENIKILDDYLTLCEKNNIRPIMFMAPVTEGYIKHFNKRILDEFYYLVEKACMRHPSAIFFDGWKILGLTDADFFDVSHMNIYGAARFSAFLNDFIEGLER